MKLKNHFHNLKGQFQQKSDEFINDLLNDARIPLVPFPWSHTFATPETAIRRAKVLQPTQSVQSWNVLMQTA